MSRCTVCGTDVLSNLRYCTHCGAEMRVAGAPGSGDDHGHIDFVLRALPWWIQRGWVPRTGADAIARDLLTWRMQGLVAPPASEPNVSEAPGMPAAPRVPASTGSGPAAVSPAPAPPTAAAPEVAATSATTPSVLAPEPPGAPPTPWLAEFLSVHWLRLLAALSVAFILVGMRQVLGWEWVSAVAQRCIPLLPIGLSVALIRVGLRYHEDGRTGAFASLSAGVVLSAFAVFSVNRHWLAGAIPTTWAETGGIALATGLAADVRRRLSDEGFTHLIWAGLAAAALDAIRAYTGLPLFDRAVAPAQAVVLLALAALALLAARRSREDAQVAPLIWAHALCALGAFRAAFSVLAVGPSGSASVAVFAVAAAGYSVAARWFPGGGAPYAASGYVAAAGAALATRLGVGGLYPYSTALSVAGIHALALSRSPEPRGASAYAASESREAFESMAALSAAIAGTLVAARSFVGWLPADVGGAAGPWGQAALSALLCALLAAGYAVAVRNPNVLVGACAAWVLALLHAGAHVLPDLDPGFGYWILPGAVTLLAKGTALRRMLPADEGARWSRPLLLTGCAAAGVAVLGLQDSHETVGASAALWWALAVLVVSTCVCAGLLVRDGDVVVSRCCAATAAAAATLGGLVIGDAAMPARHGQLGACAGALALAAIWGAGMVLVARRWPDHPWRAVLSAAAGVGASMGAVAPSGDFAPWQCALLGGAGAAILVAAGAAGGSRACLWAALLPTAAGLVPYDGRPALVPILVPLSVAAMYAAAAAATRDHTVVRQAAICMAAVALSACQLSADLSHGPAGLVAGWSLVVASVGMLAAARWAGRPGYSVVGGLFAVAGYARLVTIGFSFGWEWTAVAALPVVMALLAAGWLLPDERAVFRGPLFGVADAASAFALAATCIAALTATPEQYLPAGIGLVCYALLAGVMAQPAEACDGRRRVLAQCLLAAGWVFALPIREGSGDAHTVSVALCAGSVALTALLARLAVARERRADAASSTVCVGLGALALVGGVLRLEHVWWPAALLPVWIALCAAGGVLPERLRGAVGEAVERTAAALAALACLALTLLYVDHPDRAPAVVCGALLAYAAAYGALLAWRRVPEYTILTSAALTVAASLGAHALGARWASLGAVISALGAAWVLAASWVDRNVEERRHGESLYALSSFLAIVGGFVALWHVMDPGQGRIAVLALIISGAVAFGQYLMGRGSGYGHAGAVSCFLAWSLVVYDSFRPGVGTLDLYLIPVGLYLVLLGHLAGARKNTDEAALLWWLGLLTTMTPTFVAFYTHHMEGGNPMHALLLVVECVGAVMWGIRERIRAFVYCGTLFSAGFVVVLGAGAVVQVWSGLFALALGIGLLAFVLYVSLHRQEILGRMERLGIQWDEWR